MYLSWALHKYYEWDFSGFSEVQVISFPSGQALSRHSNVLNLQYLPQVPHKWNLIRGEEIVILHIHWVFEDYQVFTWSSLDSPTMKSNRTFLHSREKNIYIKASESKIQRRSTANNRQTMLPVYLLSFRFGI